MLDFNADLIVLRKLHMEFYAFFFVAVVILVNLLE